MMYYAQCYYSALSKRHECVPPPVKDMIYVSGYIDSQRKTRVKERGKKHAQMSVLEEKTVNSGWSTRRGANCDTQVDGEHLRRFISKRKGYCFESIRKDT